MLQRTNRKVAQRGLHKNDHAPVASFCHIRTCSAIGAIERPVLNISSSFSTRGAHANIAHDDEVDSINPNKKTQCTHPPQKQIKQICQSVSRFGFTSPVVVDENDNIIAGHGRYLAAMEPGLAEIPVLVVSDLSELDKRALAIADNKIAVNAGWDRAALANELGELANLLPEINLDLSITGFEPAEIDALIADFAESGCRPGRSGAPRSRR